MPDQSDRTGENEEAVQAVNREPDIDEHRCHRSVYVQNQVVLLHRGDLFHFERKVQAGSLDVQTLDVSDQLLHSLIRIAQALDAMTDSRYGPDVLLHIGEELIDGHLV